MKHAISWFEIPSIDLDRATSFYESIFNVRLFPMDLAQIRMRLFPIDDPSTGVGEQSYTPKGFMNHHLLQALLYI